MNKPTVQKASYISISIRNEKMRYKGICCALGVLFLLVIFYCNIIFFSTNPLLYKKKYSSFFLI